MFDGVVEGLYRLHKMGSGTRRALVLWSDGFEEKSAALREIVKKREVWFDVAREQVAFQHRKSTAVGYELVLSGIHSDGPHTPFPGCDLCKQVYEDLKTIAEWILPQEHRRCYYEIEPFQPVIHTCRRRHFRTEVTLSLKILHRDHYQEPIDTCETSFLVEMKNRLRQIGVSQGEWKPR